MWRLRRRSTTESREPVDDTALRAAEAIYREGRFATVIDMLRNTGRSGSAGRRQLLLGHSYLALGLRQQAIKAYEQAIAAEPSLARVEPALACLATNRPRMSDADAEALLPNFSLTPGAKIAARRFLDRVAAPVLSTVYTNDNIIVFQRALTFLRDPRFMASLYRASEGEPKDFNDRTWRAHILLWAARNALRLPGGDLVELGTFRGYFASCLVDCLDFRSSDRHLYLYDTFEGLADDAVREANLSPTFYESLQAHYSQRDIYDSVLQRFAD